MKKKCAASMTVEAAFIFPIILFIIITILYFTLYQYDMVSIYTIMNEAVIKENQTRKQPCELESGEIYYQDIIKKDLLSIFSQENATEEEYLKMYLEQILADKLLIYEIDYISVKSSASNISITVKMSTKLTPPGGISYLGEFLSVEAHVSIPVHNPGEFVRISNNALDVVTDIKGFDKITEVMKKITRLFQ